MTIGIQNQHELTKREKNTFYFKMNQIDWIILPFVVLATSTGNYQNTDYERIQAMIHQ